ncbi:MBL fold metallo-hydrolase [bacterium]|nr:MBL fold metallo-hydrolase [bacterium]
MHRLTALAALLLTPLSILPTAPAQDDPPPAAKLRWFGQSFFQLETSGKQLVVFDPHAIPTFGTPRVSADITLISHPHNDHAQPEVLGEKGRVFVGVTGTPDGKRSDWARVDEKIKNTRVRTVATFHDTTMGMTRGKNAVWVVEADGLVFCHLGDLGHELSPDQVKAIGPVDVLMVPVGGIYTVNGEQAKKVVDQIRPKRFVLPMHYGVPGFEDLAGPDEFLGEFKDKDIRRATDTNELVIPVDAKAPDAPTVVLLGWRKAELAPPKK